MQDLRPYFLVVRTAGIKESSSAPPDAVLHAEWWHPGDRDWVATYHESIEALVADLEDGGLYKLVQITQTRTPYEYELVLVSDRSAFEGPSGEDLIKKFGLA